MKRDYGYEYERLRKGGALGRYFKMNASEMVETLYEYSRVRKGDIADLTYAAALMLQGHSVNISNDWRERHEVR